MFLCEPLRPLFLCGEVLNVFFGPNADRDVSACFISMRPIQL
jgi:hypothetical protein